MTTPALDSLPDPLVTPMLGLVKAAVNADIDAELVAVGATAQSAITDTKPHPINLGTITEGGCLAIYRIRQQGQRRVMGYLDHVVTLRVHYIAAACAVEQVDERWPLLDRVWRSAFDAICRGHHPSYEADAHVLVDAGAIWVNEQYSKIDSFVPGGDAAYPQFEADVQVTWRDLDKYDTGTLYDFVSVVSDLYVDIDPDVADARDVGVISSAE